MASAIRGCSQKMAVNDPGKGPSSDTKSASFLILDFPNFRTTMYGFLLFTSHVVDVIVMAAQNDQGAFLKLPPLYLLPGSRNGTLLTPEALRC